LEADNLIREKDRKPFIEPFIFYVEAFNELGTCRYSGMGLTPIPFTSMVEYAKIMGVDNFHEFHTLMRIMDNTLLDMESKKNAKK